MNRIDELKGLVSDLGNQLTIGNMACMFFELGWRAADESMIEKACRWLKHQEEMIGVSFEEDFIERFKQAMEE